MKEKRNIKLRTDMYEDTKFKIIDTMAERDTINYIWIRQLRTLRNPVEVN